jgi:hypothetical protein
VADSVVGIYNRALTQAGITELVTEVNEASLPAQICNLWYDTARRAVLRSAPWPSARKDRRLSLVSTRDGAWLSGQAPDPFRYAYGVPADLLLPFHLESWGSFSLRDNGSGTTLFVTNDVDPVLYYNFDQQNVQKWDEGLHLSVVFSLAVFISTPLSASQSRAQENAMRAVEITGQAMAAAANQMNLNYESQPAYLGGYNVPSTSPRFVYQFETLTLGSLGLSA